MTGEMALVDKADVDSHLGDRFAAPEQASRFHHPELVAIGCRGKTELTPEAAKEVEWAEAGSGCQIPETGFVAEIGLQIVPCAL